MMLLTDFFQLLRSQFVRIHENKVEYSFVFAIFLFGFLFFLWIFLRNQLVPVIDGPYYLIQVRSLITTGQIVYGDPPLAFILMSIPSLLFGDVSLGVKIGVTFFSALSTVPAYFLMKRVGKSKLAGFASMVLIIFSGIFIRAMSDFMKNVIGICWLLAFVYYLHDIAVSGIKKTNLALAAVFLVLTGLTHILAFGIALLFIAFYTVVSVIFNVNRHSFLKASGTLFLTVCVFVIVASVFFGSLFTDFSKALSFMNQVLLFEGNKVQGTVAQNPVGALRTRPVINSMDSFSLSLIGGWEVILAILLVGALLSFYAWRKQEKDALILLSTVTFVGAILSFPLLPNDLLGRFLLMMVIPITVLLSYGISKIWTLGGRDLKFFAVILVVVCLVLFVGQSFKAISAINPSIRPDVYADLVGMQSSVPSDSVIVTIRGSGLGYWVEYVENVDVVDIQELKGELWQSYSTVFGIFPNNQVPPIPHSTIYVGNIYSLVEFDQAPRSFSAPPPL